MAKPVIIAKNVSGADIEIIDLDVNIPQSGQLNLSDIRWIDNIYESNDLLAFVDNNTIVINDGVNDLSENDAKLYLEPWSSRKPYKRRETIYIQPNGAGLLGTLVSLLCEQGGGTGSINFMVHGNFGSLIAANLLISPDAASAVSNANLDIFSNYGNIIIGEAYNQHSESDTTSTYNLVGYADKIYRLDLSGILTSLQKHDLVGIQLKNNQALGPIRLLGAQIVYQIANYF